MYPVVEVGGWEIEGGLKLWDLDPESQVSISRPGAPRDIWWCVESFDTFYEFRNQIGINDSEFLNPGSQNRDPRQPVI